MNKPKTHLDIICLDFGLEKITDYISSLEQIRDDTFHLVSASVTASLDSSIEELEYAKKYWKSND